MIDPTTREANPREPQASSAKPAEPAEHGGFDPHDPAFSAPPATTRLVLGAATIAAIGLAALFALGIVPLKRRQRDLVADAEPSATRDMVLVSVVNPRRSASTEDLTLPGTVRPFQETAIYARTSGYLRRWLVDIGDRVQSGQLLAEIDTPELDQQIDQAKASLSQVRARLALAQANVGLAQSTLKRYEAAAPGGGITPQELDEKRASCEVARATVAAAQADVEAGEANVRRLVQLKDFASVTAPFAGTVTGRWVDVGTLVTAGNAKGQELFHLVQTNPARVYVSVPQASAPSIRDGSEAQVLAREHLGHAFVGKVARTTKAIDDASKTLLALVEVPNEDGLLLPGMYTQVKFHLPLERATFLVPQSALVVTADGTQVATVGEGDRVHYRRIVVDCDYGTEVGLSDGVAETDRVVTNPGERLVEGLVVRVAEPPKAKR
jgi:RND family efflux transporter MFP subunit